MKASPYPRLGAGSTGEGTASKLGLPAILLVILAFAAPIIGGQFPSDQLGLAPGAALYAFFGSGEIPILTGAILSLLAVVALCALLLKRRVLQIPHQAMGALMLVFLAVLSASVGTSSFKATSFAVWIQWVSYAVAFFAVVAGLGRTKGPLALVAAMFAGCVVIALLGLNEYAGMRSIDPTWRIFALWVNPNATAAMLLIGVFLGLGLIFNRDRIEALMAGLGTALIIFAIMLTGSKGVLSFALPISLTIFSALTVRSTSRLAVPLTVAACALNGVVTAFCFLKGFGWLSLGISLITSLAIIVLAGDLDLKRKLALRLAGVAATVVVLATLLSLSAPHQVAASGGPSAPFARVGSAEQTQDQSATFRLLLWKSAASLIRANPMGYGLGTYAYESSRPGLTTQTKLAHNTYLQLGAEASPLAPLLLIAIFSLWLYLVIRGGRSQPNSVVALRAAAASAVVAVGIHGLVDSDPYYFGIGISVFMLMGVSLLLASDAVAPELLPRPVRIAGTCLTVLAGVLGLYAGSVEEVKARVRGDLAAKDLPAAQAGVQMLNGIAPNDGDAWFLAAKLSQSQPDQLENLKKAVAYAPTTKNLRALAMAQQSNGQAASAYGTLQQALAVDPNNFLTLTQVMNLEFKEGDAEQADVFAKRLVATEDSEYFKTRSIPELVPTETYAARVFLAGRTLDPKQRADLLAGAVAGYLSYLNTTVPVIKRQAVGNPNADFGGESAQKAVERLGQAATAAQDLAKTYRVLGLPVKAAEPDEAAKAFAAGAAGLSESK